MNQKTTIDYTIKGQLLPKLEIGTKYRSSKWLVSPNFKLVIPVNDFISYGTQIFNNETYILAEKENYLGDDFYMFKLQDIISINKKILPTDKFRNITWENYLSKQSNLNIGLIILTSLYENNKITYEKLKGQITSMKNGTFFKRKSTYKCSVTNTIYKNKSFKGIFKNLHMFNEVGILNLIDSYRLYKGSKPFNYCLNNIISLVYSDTLKHFYDSSYKTLDEMISIDLPDFPIISNIENKDNKNIRLKNDMYEIFKYFHQYKHNDKNKISQVENLMNFYN
jgi:hypothetical protein